jgi:O-antigen/teichoic acid export membrane protein
MLVDFANVHRQGVPLKDRYLKTVAMVTATLWPGFAGLAILAEPIIILVYGERWVSAALPLTYLAIASVILVTITMTSEVFTVTGNLRQQTRIEAIRAPISLVVFVAACTISLEAAAFSRIIDAAIAVMLYRPHLNRVTGTCFGDLKRIYAHSVLLALAAAAPAGILLVWTGPRVSPQLALVGGVSLGVILWAGMLLALKHPLASEAIVTIKRRLPLRWA